jgi:hypothetical protein
LAIATIPGDATPPANANNATPALDVDRLTRLLEAGSAPAPERVLSDCSGVGEDPQRSDELLSIPPTSDSALPILEEREADRLFHDHSDKELVAEHGRYWAKCLHARFFFSNLRSADVREWRETLNRTSPFSGQGFPKCLQEVVDKCIEASVFWANAEMHLILVLHESDTLPHDFALSPEAWINFSSRLKLLPEDDDALEKYRDRVLPHRMEKFRPEKRDPHKPALTICWEEVYFLQQAGLAVKWREYSSQPVAAGVVSAFERLILFSNEDAPPRYQHFQH